MRMDISRFDPARMQENRRVVIIGKSGVGKTKCLLDIMYHKRTIPCGAVMSGTEEGNQTYQEYVPDLYVHTKYDPEIVKGILERQKVLTRLKKPNRGAFLILDDCAYDKKILKGELIREIFMNSRHFALFTILTLQFCMDMPTDLRTNADYVFICRENILSNRKRLYECFCGMFKTFKDFCAIMDQCTNNYEILVVDNTVTSNNISDCVFWYRATLREPFRIGSPEFWSFHDKKYDENHWCRDLQDDKRVTLKITKKGKARIKAK